MFKHCLISLAALGFASTTHAAITIDLRLTDGSKSAIVSPGDTVTVDVFARLPNLNGNSADDQLSSLNASFLTTGALRVDITDAVAVNPWNLALSHQDTDNPLASGFRIVPTDLDNDGDLDIGSNNAGSAAGHFLASAGQFITGTSFHVATLSLTIAGDAGSTSLNFRPRLASAGALYREDNVLRTGAATGASAGQPIVAEPIILTVAVPEPSALAAILAPAALLAARRRR